MFGRDRRSRSQHSPKPSRTPRPDDDEEEMGYARKRVRVNEPQHFGIEKVELRDVEPIVEWGRGGYSARQQNSHANVPKAAVSTENRNVYGHRLPGRSIDAHPYDIMDEDELFRHDRLRHVLMLLKKEEELAKLATHQKRGDCGQGRAKPIPNDTGGTNPQWGTSHPDFGRQTTRAKFTHIEVQWIGKFCTKLVQENPWMQSRMLVECLHAVRADFNMHKYFHPRHVTDAGRLRPGLEAFEKANGKIA
jgi:hypothetical protein